MDGFALDEMAVLILADLVLDFVDGELRFEVEEVVEHLHAAAREMIEQVGVGAVFLVEDVGQREKFFLGSKSDSFTRFSRTLPLPRSLSMRKGMKARFENVLIETVVAQRIDELDQMLRAGADR